MSDVLTEVRESERLGSMEPYRSLKKDSLAYDQSPLANEFLRGI